MKAVIPVAGAGINLRPHTYTQPKPLILVAGKPIIAFIMDQLIAEGITDFVLVLGYLGEKIKLYVDEHYDHVNVDYVKQENRMGLGHAIWTASDALQDVDEIVVILGDTIVDVDFQKFLQSPHSCLGIRKVTDPRKFGVVEFDEHGDVARVVEKPLIPKSNMALVGLYKFTELHKLLACIASNIEKGIKTHSEYQLTDGIMCMLELGCKFSTIEVNNWFDCGKRDILLETNATLLDRKESNQDFSEENFNNVIIKQPVSIGKSCEISNSIIGPHVTIGDNTRIKTSIVSDSIIGNYASIEEIVLHHSLVGHDAAIHGRQQSLNIGDNTELDLG